MVQVPTTSTSAPPLIYRAEHLTKIERLYGAAAAARVERALVLAGIPGHREPVRSADGGTPMGDASCEHLRERAEARRPTESRGRSGTTLKLVRSYPGPSRDGST
jgi:hypothetical protein